MPIKVDLTRFESARKELMRRTGHNTFPKWVRWRSRIVNGHLIRLTPPSGGTWPAQKKKGEAAVERDIDKVFGLIRFTIVNKSLRKRWEHAKRTRNLREAEEVLKVLGVGFKAVVYEAEEQLHQKQRSRRGTIARRYRPEDVYRVLRFASIAAYKRKIKSHVGFSKWGWGDSAKKLGTKGIPKWITRHAPGGQTIDRSNGLFNPFISQVHTRGRGGRDPNTIVGLALEIDKRTAILYLDKLLAGEMKRVSSNRPF